MASYKEAIEWIARNDDCYWIGDYDSHGPMISVSTALVRDLWNKTDEQIIKDIKKQLKIAFPNHEVFRKEVLTTKTD